MIEPAIYDSIRILLNRLGEKMGKYTHAIWDWNGTLLDDLEISIKSVNTLLAKRGLETLDTIEAYHNVFGFPVIDYYKRIGFDFEKEPFEVVAVEFISTYNSYENQMKLHRGANEVLEELNSRNVNQVILSASEKNNLIRQVELMGISKYFTKIMVIEDIYAGGKLAIGKEYMKNIPKGQTVFIGDSTHDFEVACGMGCDTILFAGGHQSKKTLALCNVPVLESFEELLEYI